jgi:O-acetyl-ADP-ribose deacetylase (regulator of RNase III)
MDDRLDFSFQVRQTSIHVCYSDITHLDTDAFVNSDDIHLSGASGLSRAIRKAAGPRVLDELRKFALPGRVGNIVVTNGGDLPVKYILHLMTIGYGEQVHFETLVPYLIKHVIDICNTLSIARLAMPMVNAGLINLEPAQILKIILQGSTCYLTDLPACALREITLALYDDTATDHAAAEAHMLASLTDIRDQIAFWDQQTKPINQLLEHLLPLRQAYFNDLAFQASLDQHIHFEQQKLFDLFKCAEILPDVPALINARPRVGGAPRSQEEYQRAKNRLTNLLDALQRDVADLERIKRTWEQNLRNAQEQEATYGGHAPIELVNDMDNANRKMSYYQQQIDQVQRQRDIAIQELEEMMRIWEPGAADETANPANRADEELASSSDGILPDAAT